MPGLTAQQREEAEEAFQMFDKNGDGKIASNELMAVMRALGQNPTQAEVDSMIKELDGNGNGYIEKPEFFQGIEKRGIKSREQEEEELKAAFKVFDKDGNGFITVGELRHAMKNLGETMTDDELEAMVEEADSNGDGKINYQEFSRIIAKH